MNLAWTILFARQRLKIRASSFNSRESFHCCRFSIPSLPLPHQPAIRLPRTQSSCDDIVLRCKGFQESTLFTKGRVMRRQKRGFDLTVRRVKYREVSGDGDS